MVDVMAGIRVLEFGIGFPPRAKILRSRGDTLYTLNWLPIGGFVKLEGEDGDAADDPRSFAHAGLPMKVVILLAGVLMNLLLAFAIFAAIAWLATPYVGLRFFVPFVDVIRLDFSVGNGFHSTVGINDKAVAQRNRVR